MRSFAFSAGRRAASGLAAGASVTAAQPSAQAREVVQQAPCVTTARLAGAIEDQDWLVTDYDQEVLVFKPFRPSDVDAAVEQVQAMMDAKSRPRSVVIEELDHTHTSHTGHTHTSHTGHTSPASEPESFVSLGAEADAVLCQPFNTPNNSSINLGAGGGHGSGEVHDFLKIASKLLKRPGLQKEVFKCMLEDREVCDLMLKQSRNIDAYLMAAGVHTAAGLLEAPEPRLGGAEGETDGETDRNVLHHILDAVAACIDKTGSWLAGMGGWFKDRFGSLGSLLANLFGISAEEEEREAGARQAGGATKQRNAGDAVLGAVMVVTVAVFCVLLARSPGLLRTAAAGASAAAMAAQQQAAATRRTTLG